VIRLSKPWRKCGAMTRRTTTAIGRERDVASRRAHRTKNLATLAGGAMAGVAILLTGCADDGATSASTAAVPVSTQARGAMATRTPTGPRIPPQDFAPGTAEDGASSSSPPSSAASQTVALVNDPSAPVDTPVCGAAARGANAIDASIYPQSLTAGGACARNACFSPLTGTFIAADGSRSVCR